MKGAIRLTAVVSLSLLVPLSPAAAAGSSDRPAADAARIAPRRSVPPHAHLAGLDRVLDGRLARETRPEAMCATSDALDAYLEGRYRAQRRRAARPAEAAGGTDATSTTPGVRMRDGIWIVESDDTILANDDPQDLLGSSLRFTPSGSGYDVALEPYQYDTNVGTLAMGYAPARLYIQRTLANFSFPMGGNSYSTLFIGTDISVRTSNPSGAPVFAGDEYTVTAAGADLFSDRVDRLSPLFFARGDNWGRFIYIRDTPAKLLITWRTSTSPASETFYVDVQAALFPDGTILYSYRNLKNVDNGSPYVYSRIQSWIDGFQARGAASDPVEGGTGRDIVNLSLEEDPATDLVHARVTMAADIPSLSTERVHYWLVLSQGGSPVYRFYTWVDKNGRGSLYVYSDADAAWYREGRPSLRGANWDVVFSLSEFEDLAAGPVDVDAETWLGDAQEDAVTLASSTDGGARFERDYTAGTPFSTTRPVMESFLYPEFLTRGAKEKLLAHTGWDETLVDGIPMYQSFFTDVVLWAGAYYSYGNCGAANMGRCDPDSDLRPGLLHMNKTNHGWNNAASPDRFTVLSHEFGHHWLQLVNIDEGAGPSDVLNPQSAHPAGYVQTDAHENLVTTADSSVMGGGYWRDNGDGTYTTPPYNTYYSYSPYELYLMGLMSPSEVPDWFYLKDTNPPQPLSYWANVGVTVTAEKRPVTIQMLMDAMGTRSPAYPAARSDFFTPLMLVVRPGQEPSAADWEFMMSVRDPWRSSFRTQTANRATLATVSPREVSPPGAVPLRVERIGADLRFRFENPSFSDQVRYNLYEGTLGGSFDDWSALKCAEIAAAGAPGELFLDATPSTASGGHYYLVTMSNVALEGSPGGGSDGVERTTTAGRCGGW